MTENRKTLTAVCLCQIGAEYIYLPRTAHKVNPKKAVWIAEHLNNWQWKLLPGYMWRVVEIDYYSAAFDYASGQTIITGKRGTTRRGDFALLF